MISNVDRITEHMRDRGSSAFRAKKIAELQSGMIVNTDGEIDDVISLEDKASKGKSGLVIPINKALRSMLTDYLSNSTQALTGYVVRTERSEKFSANAVAVYFRRLYTKLGLVGCSSH